MNDRQAAPRRELLLRGDRDVLGREAHVEPMGGIPVITWETDEPSSRGIEGMERMRLIRDDITNRVKELAQDPAFSR